MFVSPPLSPVEAAVREAYAASRNGDFEKARTAALNAIKLDAEHLEAWYVLGNTAFMADQFANAIVAFGEGARRAPAASPTQAQFVTLRASALSFNGQTREAVEDVRSVLANIQDGAGLAAAASILSQAGLQSEALPLFKKAVHIAPDNAAAWHGLGGTLQSFGDLDGAEDAYQRSIAVGQRNGTTEPMTYPALARLRRWTSDNNHIPRLEATQCRHSQDAMCVAYALFKEYNDIGNRSAAWEALEHGAMIANSMAAWSHGEDDAVVAAWREYFPPARFRTPDDRPRPGPKRIFIVGLPRSGTTLVERILASHSQVQSLGELKTFGVGVKVESHSETGALLDVETIAASAETDPLAFAQFYDRETAYLHDGSGYTTDKLPNNHEYAGLIRLAFPDAVIIHVQRDPMDSLFGAYKLLFSRSYNWSYTQDDLARHYGHYRNLMAWWSQCLAQSHHPLVDVSLEAIIRNPESQIRRLLDLCGLPFEEACLQPHESKGAVSTASSAQVRSPINADGVGAWRNYTEQLTPLRNALQSLGWVDADGNACQSQANLPLK